MKLAAIATRYISRNSAGQGSVQPCAVCCLTGRIVAVDRAVIHIPGSKDHNGYGAEFHACVRNPDRHIHRNRSGL